jgi:hypothetical protein
MAEMWLKHAKPLACFSTGTFPRGFNVGTVYVVPQENAMSAVPGSLYVAKLRTRIASVPNLLETHSSWPISILTGSVFAQISCLL